MTLVLKPNDEYGGVGVTLRVGGRRGCVGHHTRSRAWRRPRRAWVVRERIPCVASCSREFADGHGAVIGDMLVDCAPYLFRGKLAGFLTRLSATGGRQRRRRAAAGSPHSSSADRDL